MSNRPYPSTYRKCVYLLGFKSTHKVYIGSTVRWPARKRQHLNDLNQNKHTNTYLQWAYNRYAKDGVFFEELEFFDDEISMRYGEQKWIAFYRSTERECGFNLVQDAVRRGRTGCKLTPKQLETQRAALAKARREHPDRFVDKPRGAPGTYTVYNPAGDKVTIINLTKYCRDHGLNVSCMRSLVRDGTVECDGWKLTLDRTHKAHVRFDIIGPNDERVQGSCLNEFSRSRGLPFKSMNDMWNGGMKVCKGWRRFDMSVEEAYTHKGKTYALVHSDGAKLIVNNLKAHCRKHGLNHEVIRKGYTNQGWRIKK